MPKSLDDDCQCHLPILQIVLIIVNCILFILGIILNEIYVKRLTLRKNVEQTERFKRFGRKERYVTLTDKE